MELMLPDAGPPDGVKDMDSALFMSDREILSVTGPGRGSNR